MIARSNMYDANKLLDKGDLDQALAKFNTAWKAWDELYNKFPSMMIDDSADDVVEAIDRYRKLLDEPQLPEDFPLKNFLRFREIKEANMVDQTLLNMVSTWPTRYPDRNFLTEMLRKSEEIVKQPEEPAVDPAVTQPTPEPPTPAQEPATPDEPATIEVAAPDVGDAPVPTKASAEKPAEPAPTEPEPAPVDKPAEPDSPAAKAPAVEMPEDGAPPKPD